MKSDLEHAIDELEDIDERDLYISQGWIISNQGVVVATNGALLIAISLIYMGMNPIFITLFGAGIFIIGIVVSQSTRVGGIWSKIYGINKNKTEKIEEESSSLHNLIQARQLMKEGDSE